MHNPHTPPMGWAAPVPPSDPGAKRSARARQLSTDFSLSVSTITSQAWRVALLPIALTLTTISDRAGFEPASFSRPAGAIRERFKEGREAASGAPASDG
jgi:hypothetical protein